MLKKRFRIPKDAPRQKATIQVGTPFFSLFAYPSTLPYDRFAIIASKRVDKRAVIRNTVKRKVRSCIEEYFTRLQPGFDITIVCKKALVALQRQDVCNQVAHILQKKGLFI